MYLKELEHNRKDRGAATVLSGRGHGAWERWAVRAMMMVLWVAGACGLAACDAMHGEHDEPAAQWDGKYYLEILVGADGLNASRNSDASRADGPIGGAVGDGQVEGAEAENQINNATLILYDKSIASQAFTADDKVFAVMYFDDFQPSSTEWLSAQVEIPFQLDDKIKAKTFYAILITNAGDLRSTFRTMTLPNLCRYVFSNAHCTLSAGAYSNFVMSSSAEFSLKFDGSTNTSYNSSTGLYTTSSSIKVQRLAARIDFNVELTADNYKTSGITLPGTYPYTAGVRFQVYSLSSSGIYTENLNEYFLLTDFEVLNAYQGGSYLIKRVADKADGSSGVTYFGAETSSADKATNYVLSPTDDKAEHFSTLSTPFLDAVSRPHTYKTTSEGSTSTAYTVGYVRENTNRDSYYTTLRLNGFIYQVASADSWDYSAGTRQSYEIKLRHSDPTNKGTETDPMHFGVVRNNIYRVGISKIVRMSSSSIAIVEYYKSSSDYKVFETSIASSISEYPSGPPED